MPNIYHNLDLNNAVIHKANSDVTDKLLKHLDHSKNGELNKIIESYENNFGDYIFIIGEKAVS